MEQAVECTHCGVAMTSWSAPGSPIRYYQCPFCARKHSSLYGEVFRRRAGARRIEAPSRAADPSRLPMPSEEEARWAAVRLRAYRWFERLRAAERPVDRRAPAGPEAASGPPVSPGVPARVAARGGRAR
jgi:hypothetical protein